MWRGQIIGDNLYLKFYYEIPEGTNTKEYELKKLLIQLVKRQFSEQALGLMKASWHEGEFPELKLKLEFKDFVKAVREGIFHLLGK